MKTVHPSLKIALVAIVVTALESAAFAPDATSAPVKTTPLKDDEIAKFLTKTIEEDKTYPDHDFGMMLKQADVPLEIKRQEEGARATAFKKYFKKHELWVVADKTNYKPGPAFTWVLALDRESAKAYLLGTNRSQVFAKNTAALFAAEKVAPKDEAEALQLGELAVSLVRYSSYVGESLRKDMPEAQLKAWTPEQLAKFTEPGVKKDKGFRVTYPVYEAFQFPPRTKTLIVYEIDFAEGGEMKVAESRLPIK